MKKLAKNSPEFSTSQTSTPDITNASTSPIPTLDAADASASQISTSNTTNTSTLQPSATKSIKNSTSHGSSSPHSAPSSASQSSQTLTTDISAPSETSTTDTSVPAPTPDILSPSLKTPTPISASTIRAKFLAFQKSRGHTLIPPSPLVLADDPTTLFTGSGMQPLLPYLLGQPHPAGRRLADSQPCLRLQDIDDVGDPRHTTVFEMLGNWSLGDYFKEEQIQSVFQFLTAEIGLDPHKIYVTCFTGCQEYGIPRDDEAAHIWQKVFKSAGIDAKIADIGTAENGDKRGIKPGERIFFYDDQENWWSRGGGISTTPLGDPCGPDSEIFYDFGEDKQDIEKYGQSHPASDGARFMEIGNSVFMQYKRNQDGTFSELEHKNVDFGAGLERITAAANDSFDVFKISLMHPIITKIEQISGKNYDNHTDEMRVIADHLRGAYLLSSQGLKPSNKAQGYVLRRLIRRAILKALNLGIDQNFLRQTLETIAHEYDSLPEDILPTRTTALETLEKEEKAFRTTLRKGLREMQKLASQSNKVKEAKSPSSTKVSEPSSILKVPAAPSTAKASETPSVAKTPETTDVSASPKIPEISNVSISPSSPETSSTSKAPSAPGIPAAPSAVDSGKEQGTSTSAPALSGFDIFKLQDTYGFPRELSVEEAYRQNLPLTPNWRQEFETALAEQRTRSQTASKGMFKGGLENQGEITTKYHTATHLLLAALCKVISPDITQKGSNITADRLRFDFNLDHKLSPEEIKQVEDQVNSWITADLPVTSAEYDKAYARDVLKVHGQFWEKYPEKLTVYTIGPVEENTPHPSIIPQNGEKVKTSAEKSPSTSVNSHKINHKTDAAATDKTSDPLSNVDASTMDETLSLSPGTDMPVVNIAPDPSSNANRPVSQEVCGGPHVTHTGLLGHFRIKKEESSSAGVRRIKAILE